MPFSSVGAAKKVVILGGAHGSLALARSLGALGVAVWYVSNDSPLTGWSRYVEKSLNWPGPGHADAAAILIDLAKKNGLEGALLVASSDSDVKFVSSFLGELKQVFQVMLPDWERLKWLCDKTLLYQRAAELNLAFPKTYRVRSLDEAKQISLEFPVILKPDMGGHQGSLAKAKAFRADDQATFVEKFSQVADEIGVDKIVVQQLIPGGGECQFSYAAFWHEGRPVAEFTARRTRQYPVDFGLTSTFVEVVDLPEALEASRVLLQSVQFSGLVEIEFKQDPRNGTLNILDVNPRPWSWFALGKAAGVDLGKIMWEAAGNSVSGQSGQGLVSTGWMYGIRDAIAAATLWRRGQLTLSAYLSSFGCVRSFAAFSWADIKPGVLDLPLTVVRVLARRVLKLSN